MLSVVFLIITRGTAGALRELGDLAATSLKRLKLMQVIAPKLPSCKAADAELRTAILRSNLHGTRRNKKE